MTPTLNEQLFEDFIHFSQRQYDCLDYDPFHGLLVHLQQGLDPEEALWHSILYMAFYNIGSSYVAFEEAPSPSQLEQIPAKLPVGVQRRNLRGGKVLPHLVSVAAKRQEYGSLYSLLTADFSGDQKQDWFQLQRNLMLLWGNGRWSVYTTAELLQKVNHLPVTPCDLMNDGSSGPRAGLQKLYQHEFPKTREAVLELDKLGDSIFALAKKRLRTNIPYLPKRHYDHAMLESQLCDFNSMLKGMYYVGRDIDRDQERIRKAELVVNRRLDDVWEARAAVFDHRYLGELNGWFGRTDFAKQHYLRTGEIADHQTIREQRGVLF